MSASEEMFHLIAGVSNDGSRPWCDEARRILDAYRAEVLAEASAARTAAPELPVWLGSPVVCPHCTAEQSHCNGCGFDMYDPPIGGGE